LREVIDYLVIQWIVLFCFSSNVLFSFSPCILWSSPWAVTLDSDVVSSSTDSEETTFTPVRSPRVSHCPVLLAIFSDTVAYNWDVVYDV
jgi:hypothetical protein